MWKRGNGRLIHTIDETRIKFRTNISKSILEYLNRLAEEHDTYVNYLLENGLENVLSEEVVHYNKDLRPKDRIQYKTTYDKELLQNVKLFAKDHHLYINDIVEYSVQFIDFDRIKNSSYKNRIE
ncbi:rRNA methyltransferase [Virgibacillus doumboii]|uniref:rRNA methyltransferase n=1 Tax=Virgibacillus doumboii TaxID=2697503 RepID=UPI0013DEB804|nr:rRNA methyltransferase [Virgibacillus doumboii]